MPEFETKPRYVPRLVLCGGVAFWLVLVVWVTGFFLTIPLNELAQLDDSDFASAVWVRLVFVALGVIDVCVFAVWVTSSIILAFNLLSKARRRLFRTQLIKWCWAYAIVMFLGILLLLLPD